MKKLITETELRALAGDSKQVVIPPDSILTPSALDLAKFMNLTLQRAEGAPAAASAASTPAVSGNEPTAEEIRRIVKL